ncbi:hypothetical protein CWR43_17380 [Rhizobium sullae]|uniref:ABC transmembrane type-1 domain-containing protein n=2 Tax=Rhizobium sullae TaxID=50338 RepID=A0A2N0D889_RHISU|nr:hypothetical protein CWR43_17380 [Rhizobium sullae]
MPSSFHGPTSRAFSSSRRACASSHQFEPPKSVHSSIMLRAHGNALIELKVGSPIAIRWRLKSAGPSAIIAHLVDPALGLSRVLALRLVVLPMALRQALAAYSNEIILMVKGTSLASIITLTEATGIAQELISQTYRAMEVFIAAGAIYLVLNFITVWALARLETRLTPDRVRA